MTLRLTPDMLAAAYDLLRETPPFKRWRLPPSDEVGFHVVRDPRIHADFGAENGMPIIRVSENGAGYAVSLLAALAHEAIHLHQWRRKLDKGGEHNADFKKRARQVCRAHGFDPKTF